MGKVKIDKHDHLRVILTETLPYEVPINFLNEGFYHYLKGQQATSSSVDLSVANFITKFFDYEAYTKPYNYRIHKNSKSKRLLSVPHPAVQVKISNLYKDYDTLITELCSRSPMSLRAPSRVASRFYERELVNYSKPEARESVEVEKEGFEKESNFASSYFTYKKYNFLYKYYDSYESHRIEKKFEHLTRFDISKCFHNIFVPSFGWAVKGKEFAKRYSQYFSVESQFEQLMLKANQDEDSGIIIGPEFSRIFAEVILQRIDLNIIEEVKSRLKLRFDSDYTIRRYVDDYFLYTKNKSTANKILDVVLGELEDFKLFVNESKTEFVEVPFITGLTIAKMDAKDLVSKTFERLLAEGHEEKDDASFIKSINPSITAKRFIKDLKRLVKENDVSYESLSGYTLGEIRRKFYRILEDERVKLSINKNRTDQLLRTLLFVLEISFFIYSMDIRVRTTYIITQIVVRLNTLTEVTHASFKDSVRKKIYDESTLLLSKMKDKGKANSIETLNLLVSIRTNFDDYPISESKLIDLFDLVRDEKTQLITKKDGAQLGYFQLMVLSSFIEDKAEHCAINSFIENEILEVFTASDSKKVRSSTDLTCMMFDSFSNPFFSEEFKKSLFNDVCSKLDIPLPNYDVLDYIKSREWFFTWQRDNLAQILMKKELRSPY
ncbi:antiviral reverse transcriptase Drt3b [Idiomarina sp.]|uniref:antiviral reverse transcriptase Drt3b n=1 Tax=Idiomarina sp. TaxID=1874361 RepID=UPI0025C2ABD4|nr:antiviral reverse transcriptase Drt3b [Idiomarina sp.]NQZ05500.1 RNA-directed DNA polymerase [Idiomarina sp.]